MSDGTPPGWYPDPVDTDVQRYWDGEQWIGEAIPADATPPASPPSPAPAYAPEPQPASAAVATQVEAPAVVPGLGPGQPTLVYGEPLAPVSARFMARFVDILAVAGLNLVVNGWFLYQWWQEVLATLPETQRYLAGQISELPPPTDRAVNLQYAIFGIGIALWFAYEVPALASSGQTLGKRLFQVRVIRADGARPGFRAAFSRWSFMAIPHLVFPCLVPLQVADALWCTWDRPLQRCLHDRWARTLVVHAPPVPTPEPSGGNHDRVDPR
ncbi:MAG: RDD family protein [Micromonosporaceae bacterium]